MVQKTEKKFIKLEDKKAKWVFFSKTKKIALLKDSISILSFKKEKSNLYKSGISNSFFLIKKLLIFNLVAKNIFPSIFIASK